MKRILFTLTLALLLTAPSQLTRAGDSGGDCGCVEYKCAGAVGGVDLTYFRMYGAQGAGGNSNVGNNDDYFADSDFQADGRVWFGYEWSNGAGIRARLFEWEDSQLYNGSVREQDIEMYDIEGTLDMSYGSWEVTGFGGIRWGSIELTGNDFGSSEPMDFEGVGMTMGVDLRRNVWGNISLVGGVRYAVLYGDTSFAPVSAAELDNTFVDVTEMRLGVEWARPLNWGGRLFVSAAWEQQVYGTDTYLVYTIDPETPGDISLAGPVFSIGIDR